MRVCNDTNCNHILSTRPIRISYEIALLSRISVLKKCQFNMHLWITHNLGFSMIVSRLWPSFLWNRIYVLVTNSICWYFTLKIWLRFSVFSVFTFRNQSSQFQISKGRKLNSDDYSKVFLIQNSLVQCSDKQFPRSENEIVKNLEGWRDGEIVNSWTKRTAPLCRVSGALSTLWK